MCRPCARRGGAHITGRANGAARANLENTRRRAEAVTRTRPSIERTYLVLQFGNTLAGALIWGINTLFLLDAGLDNTEAFAANAFFAAGMVIFEVPTGVVADTWGRRASYLMGTATLAASTFLYWVLWTTRAPFSTWAFVSLLLGLGFTFFSGAVEAWLVDALDAGGRRASLDRVLGRGQIVTGIAMLVGSLAGGAIAQLTTLGIPFLIRTGILIVMFFVALVLMHDIGFEPHATKGLAPALRSVVRGSIEQGLKNRPVRWVMLGAPFSAGAGFYVFYAAQPYLLALHGGEQTYLVAGLAAALVAGAQIAGGWAAPKVRSLFAKRTTVLLASSLLGSCSMVLLGLTSSLVVAILAIMLWGIVYAAERPVRQAYLNDLIPSSQRATILSFDSLMGNAGGVVAQPALGRVADLHGYAASFLVAGFTAVLATPFLVASRREHARADVTRDVDTGS